MKKVEFDYIKSPLVIKAYEELPNFIVENLENDEAGYCIVYCTSNGLYFPNTEENFLNTVYKKTVLSGGIRNIIFCAQAEIFILEMFISNGI